MNDSKDCQKDVEKRLESGERKKDIFVELSSKVEDLEAFGWRLSHTPYPFLRNKYKIHCIILSALIIIFSAQNLLSVVHFRPNQIGVLIAGLFAFIFGFGWMAYKVFIFMPGVPFIVSYLGGIYFCIYGIGSFRKLSLSIETALELFTSIVLFLYGYWISKQLAPKGPRGIILKLKAPRNAEGEIEFD